MMNYQRVTEARTHIIQARKGETTEKRLDEALKAIDSLLLVVESLEKDVRDLKAKR